LITFADLKKYKYYYWFGFPAFVSKPAWEIGEDGWKDAADALSRDDVRPPVLRLESIVHMALHAPVIIH
jgi:hypothetical protein